MPVDGAAALSIPTTSARRSRTDTFLISIMHANNEVGTIQPIAEIAKIAREHGIPLHTDAAQSVGKIPTKVDELGVDLLSVAGHKVYAPKGIGALYIRRGMRSSPDPRRRTRERPAGRHGERAADGGPRQGLRDCADPGSACRRRASARPVLGSLRAAFGNRVALNGHPDRRLPNTLNVSFVGRVGAEILATHAGVAARPARLVIPVRSRCRRCWRPWASRPRSAWAPSASASGALRPRTRSRRSSINCAGSSHEHDRAPTTIGPNAYASWRATTLGAVTDAIEQRSDPRSDRRRRRP